MERMTQESSAITITRCNVCGRIACVDVVLRFGHSGPEADWFLRLRRSCRYGSAAQRTREAVLA